MSPALIEIYARIDSSHYNAELELRNTLAFAKLKDEQLVAALAAKEKAEQELAEARMALAEHQDALVAVWDDQIYKDTKTLFRLVETARQAAAARKEAP